LLPNIANRDSLRLVGRAVVGADGNGAAEQSFCGREGVVADADGTPTSTN